MEINRSRIKVIQRIFRCFTWVYGLHVGLHVDLWVLQVLKTHFAENLFHPISKLKISSLLPSKLNSFYMSPIILYRLGPCEIWKGKRNKGPNNNWACLVLDFELKDLDSIIIANTYNKSTTNVWESKILYIKKLHH